MSATEHLADPADTRGEPACDEPDQAGGEAARARAYLDLWERHLVHISVRGRLETPGRRAAPTKG